MFRGFKASKNLLRVLLLALAMVLLCVAPAFAAEASTWSEVREQVSNGDTITIILTDDVRLNWQASTLEITNGKNVTIDLNGHTITGDSGFGAAYLHVKNGTLTIIDSAEVKISSESAKRPARHDQDDTVVSNGTGIALPATFSGDKLTYYTTASTVKNTIYTEETLKKHTVDLSKSGRLVGLDSHWTSLVVAEGSNATLRIEGGLFTNPNNQAVRVVDGAQAEIVGGYFCGNLNPYDGGTGGAVLVQKATLTVGSGNANDQVIFADNRAVSGGALAANEEGTTVTIRDGAVFSGNKATGSGHDGGGAILIGEKARATMEGGLVTHNWCTDNMVGANEGESSYDVCGGGIMVHGTLKMTGGQVTSNEAPGGGGISTKYWNGGVFFMTDGIVAGNVARLNEGGGITINMNGRGSIIGGHITNNRAEGKEHWGGGGIFSSNDSVLTMINTLIAHNEAGGFGGGLAGCSTARVDTHSVEIQNHSVAIYDNKADGKNTSGNNSTKNEDHLYALSDPVFMRPGKFYQDYFSALNTTVCGGFLGQGDARWEGTIDSTIINQGDIKPGEKITSQSIAGLTSNPTRGDISNAIKDAEVFVTGNYAYTHGGGILSNGYMIIGSHRFMEIGDRMTLVGDKTLSGGDGQLKDGQFKFQVEDGAGNKLFAGTNNASSEIIFNGRLTFDKAGTYTFKVYELDEGIPEGVTKDPTVYTIVVTVTATENTVYAVNDDDIFKTEAIKVTFNKISAVKVYKSGAADPVLDLDNIDKDDRSAYALPGHVLEFVNRISEDTGIVVSKTVHDASNNSANEEFEFTITLSDKTINGTHGDMTFKDGVATFTLKAGQAKRATELPAGTTYTVTETAKAGYYTPGSSKTGTVVDNDMVSVVFENYAVGALKLTKTVNSPNPADADRDFNFRITLIGGGNDVYSGVTFTNGVAIVELKHGESITIENLPAGLEYTIEELNGDGFKVENSGITGVIAINQTKTASFTNTRETGELHVRKYVANAPKSNPDPEFEFTVSLLDATYLNGTFGDMTFVDGVAKVKLGHGDVAKATGLPLGAHYRITEAKSDEYAVSVVGSSSGAIVAQPTVVEYTNTYFAGLQISKITTGSELDREKAFEFGIILEGPDGNPVSGTYSDVVFVDGKASIFLKNGQSKIIDGLAAGTKATVTEIDADTEHFMIQLNGVNVTTNPTGTFTLESDANVHAQFTNLHRVGSLEISKTTVSPIADDLNHQFAFDVVLSAPINGTFGDMIFTEGRATVYLKNGQSAKAENIPVSVTYTVTEQPVTGFDSVPAESQTGTILEGVNSLAYTNTRRVGGMKLTKVVLAGQDTEDEFGFKVILAPAYSGVFGDMTFTDGVAEFTLKDEESIEAQNLPEGTVYQIVETKYDSTHFAPVVGMITGNITAATTKEINFTNRALGTLTVSKRVDGYISEADQDKEFAFTVTLGDTTINGLHGDMTFTDGVAEFTLKHGESMTATGLSEGITYTVTEAVDEDYTAASIGDTGTITPSGAAAATFVNTRKVGDLTIRKSVVSNRATDVNTDFVFTVTLSDTTINGTFGSMTFVDGVATVTLKGSQSKTAQGLPAGIIYTVTETEAEGFKLTSKAGDTGEITETAATATFINTRVASSLTVTKKVEGEAVDPLKKFAFTVTLKDATITGVYGDMSFIGGVAEFELGNGESKTAVNLPIGTEYTIAEQVDDNYTTTYNGVAGTEATGTIADLDATIEVTNTLKTGDLKVTKTVAGNAAEEGKKFTFTVTLVSELNGTYGDMTFVNGEATFELGHGESKTAVGLPAGIDYTVTENHGGYVVSVNGEDTDTAVGTVTSGETVIAFTNTKTQDVGGLKVEKAVVGYEADKQKEFYFTVTLDDPTINGTYGSMTFTEGISSFTLKDGESLTAENLPVGTGYIVAETEDDAFVAAYTGEIGTIVKDTILETKVTNTRKLGSLTVSKSVNSANAGDLSKEFAFTVTLGDATITGTYGDMTFTTGVATFTLANDQFVTAANLPANIAYTVTEEAGDYTVTKTGDTGVIPVGATTEVKFVNTFDSEDGELKVTKTISGNAVNMTDRFGFTVTLSDLTLSGTFGEMTFANGVATFDLGHGESKTAAGLPAGISYTVKEQPSTYAVYASGDSGIITSGTTSVAQFINTRNISLGGLTVTKTVTGEDGSKTQPFRFTVELLDTSINGTYGEMLFVNGVANFTLTDGESRTAVGLLAGTQYRVTEENSGYLVTKTGDVGYIPADGVAMAAFTNHLSIARGDLRVTKYITGNDADMTRKFSFRVTLNSPVNGTYGNMTFVNGVATFALGHGESAFATRLPAGVQYSVEELDFEDYIVTATDEVGTIEADLSKQVTFINERSKIDVPDTGDHTMLSVYSVLLMLSAALLVIRSIKARKA